MVFVLLGVILSGCNKGKEIPVELMKVDYEERHPIKVHKYVADVRFDVSRVRSGLNEMQKGRLREFLRKYKQNGNGVLIVASPKSGDNEVAAYKAVNDIRSVIEEARIAPGLVRYTSFSDADMAAYKNASSYSARQIHVAYRHYVAKAKDCGDWSENMANNNKNLNYRNFGCAQQYNLAAMIDDPRDLERHRGLDSRSSSRRDVIWDKYVKGDSTIAKRTSDERGTVSDVAKQ